MSAHLCPVNPEGVSFCSAAKDGKCLHGFTAMLKSGTCIKKVTARKRKTKEATP